MPRVLLFEMLTILTLTFVGFNSFAVNGNERNPNRKKADSIFFQIYNSEYPAAEIALIQSKKEIDPLICELLTLELMWWKTLSINQKQDFLRLEQSLKDGLNKVKISGTKNSLQELIYSSYMLRLLTMRNEYLKIPKYYFQINSIVGTINNSAFSPTEKNMFEIYSAVFNMGKSKFVFSRTNSKNANINTLIKYEKSTDFIERTISTYFLGKVYSDIEKMPENAIPCFKRLHTLFPNNDFFVTEIKKFERNISKQK